MDLATRKGICKGWSESLVFRSVLKAEVIWPQSAFSNFYKPFFKKKKLLLAPISGAKNSGNTIGQWQRVVVISGLGNWATLRLSYYDLFYLVTWVSLLQPL